MSIKSLGRKFLSKYIISKISDNLDMPVVGREAPRPLKMSLLGACQFDILINAALGSPHRMRQVLLDCSAHGLVPDALPDDDLAVVNIPLRQIVSDASGLPLPKSDMVFARLETKQDAERLIEDCKARIADLLSKLRVKYNHIPLFFMEFFEPSFNYLGALQDRYSTTSPRHILRRLNEILSDEIQQSSNFYLLDTNDILNYVGKRYLHDDIVLHGSHASFINDWDFKLDAKRLSAPQRFYSAVAHERAIREFTKLLLNRIEHAVKIIANNSQIKLIICDIDDTLWRGIGAESEEFSDTDRIEGWPLGLIEALLFFKARGGILALCSKNDEADTAARFERIFRGAISFDDFASIRINWQPKSSNISEILKETNILAKNSLFIDDNVREISEVVAHHPEIRCLGTDHYNWRKIVLQSPETQVPFITAESAQRTELVRATAKRHSEASNLSGSNESRQKWLESLKLKQVIWAVKGPDSKYYDRSFELINKTNQFNTTGKRWAAKEFQNFLEGGGICLVSALKDENIDNGIISVCLIDKNQIVQIVLSCRVFGLGAEIVMGAKAVELILKRYGKAYGQVVDTGRNATCLGYFTSLGFASSEGRFEIDHPIAAPNYIEVSDKSDVGFLDKVAAS